MRLRDFAQPLDAAEEWPSGTMHIPNWNSMGDRQKVRVLRKVAEHAGRDPDFRSFVVNRVLAGVPDRAYRQQAAAMLSWTQRNIRYINEPDEQIAVPKTTVRLGFGDCDDMAALIAGMAHAVGLPFRFILAGRDGRGRPCRWEEGTMMPWFCSFYHIYVGIGDHPFQPHAFIPADATVPGAPLGFDVVIHNHQLPELQNRAQARAQSMAGWGAMGATSTLQSRVGALKRPAAAQRSGVITSLSAGVSSQRSALEDVETGVYQDMNPLEAAWTGFVSSIRDPDAWRDVGIAVISAAMTAIIVDRVMARYQG